MSRPKPSLTVINPDDFHLVVLSDGTITTAEVIQREYDPYRGRSENQVGWGVARRRKGDRRDPDLGVRLAVSRAFRDAAEKIEERLADDDQS